MRRHTSPSLGSLFAMAAGVSPFNRYRSKYAARALTSDASACGSVSPSSSALRSNLSMRSNHVAAPPPHTTTPATSSPAATSIRAQLDGVARQPLDEKHGGQSAAAFLRTSDDRAQPCTVARQQLAVFSVETGMG